jgi:hypothetical protein
MNDPRDTRQTAAPAEALERATQGEVSALARHADPSLKTPTPGGPAASKSARRAGIEWVRASELLNRGAFRVADRGAVGREAAIRRARRAVNPVSRRGIARRSSASLPPPSAFGTPPSSSVSRSPGIVP